MVEVWIPSQLRALTDGRDRVSVQGGTLRDVISALDGAYPGLQTRLLEGESLRPGIAALIDGETRSTRLSQPLAQGCELHFIFAISGG